MSGRKRSNIYLERSAELLLKVKREKDATQKKIAELTHRIENLLSKINGISTKDAGVTKRITEHTEFLRKEALNSQKKRKELEDIELPEVPSDVNETHLTGTQQSIRQIDKESQEMWRRLDEIELEITNLSVADKTLSNIEFNREKFQNAIQMQEDILKKWLPDEHSKLTQDWETFQEKLTQHKEALEKRKETAEAVKNLKEAEQIFDNLNTELAKLAQEAMRREELHQKRLYILKALREVCASLGFEEVSEPMYEEEGNFNSPIVQTFDTINEGVITFTLHLDNRIESNSGIKLEVCEDEFGKLSELLAQKYGVQTEFKRVGEEGEPKRKTKTEKPIPRQDLRRKRFGATGN